MKKLLCGICGVVLLSACGRNEPGTMGGEPGVPESVATGAPGQTQEERVQHDDPAMNLEKQHNTFDNAGADTNEPGSGVGTGQAPMPSADRQQP